MSEILRMLCATDEAQPTRGGAVLLSFLLASHRGKAGGRVKQTCRDMQGDPTQENPPPEARP